MVRYTGSVMGVTERMQGRGLTERICRRARDLGFDRVGVAPARPVPHLDAYRAWLARGYHGEMGYVARPDRVARREDPARIVPRVGAIVCVGLNYYPGALPPELTDDPSRGLISNYAWGVDYHDLMMVRLEELAAFIHDVVGTEAGRQVRARAYVDTGPVLERACAAQAGLGFIGKNTCLIDPRMGSWLFLGEILLDVELEPTTKTMDVSCGTCRRCLDACPTGALVAPYVLDARRCISYLTIELKGPIPHELRPLMGRWIYGCDVCQSVCPWQRFARPTREPSFRASTPDRGAPSLLEVMEMGEEAFRQRYRGTPIYRIGRGRLLRNAAVALGNWGDERGVPVLRKALADPEPLVREHAAWALERMGEMAS
jgi:epoxyqueuosine reductase